MRWFRPFPTEELRACLRRFKAVGVIDRDFAHGSPDDGGVVLHEIRSCLYPVRERPNVVNFIGGLGGRDISIADCTRMFELTEATVGQQLDDARITWIGVRE
jgi:pyruvate ferredoxin oxidoreductase alpha subunit